MKKIIAIKNTQKGQSMVEMVFAITVVALVITGAVVLIANSIGVKSRTFDRKKAMELAEIVMEDLIDQKKNNSTYFWEKNIKIGETLPNFSGYSYDVGYSGYNGNGCDIDECITVIITVNWANGQNVNVKVNKFFSKEVN